MSTQRSQRMSRNAPKSFNSTQTSGENTSAFADRVHFHPFRQLLVNEVALTLSGTSRASSYRPVFYLDEKYGTVDLRKIVISARNLCEAYVKFGDYVNEHCKFPCPGNFFDNVRDCMTKEDMENLPRALEEYNENDTLWLEIAEPAILL